jgi:transketolase N-terminal domain/subunit/transketolase C-terminal domain/subunit
MKTKFSPAELQQQRNQALLANSIYMRRQVVSSVPPLQLDIGQISRLSDEDISLFEALQIESARLAIESVASLSKINEVDHMGGGLDLIPPLLLTLSLVDHAATDFTIENAHTSIGYFSALATLGYLDRQQVIDFFRRGLDIPGHVSWVPGGTQLSGGRLGVMIPTAVGQALGKRAAYGSDAWVLCHTGDAGWIAGHALNGFHAARIHKAPVTFIMHRNGIQLSGTTRQMTMADPRPVIEALGIQILETPSLYDVGALWQTLREASSLARNGVPSLIFPTGKTDVTLAQIGERFDIGDDLSAFASKNAVAMDTSVWLPGCLMSYRDLPSMMECLFYVNGLPGGKAHHDGHMKGRDLDALLANPMLQLSPKQAAALERWRSLAPVSVTTSARPAPGSENLLLPDESLAKANAALPAAGGKWISPRAGVAAAYELVAKTHPDATFVIDCDLAPSTKVDLAQKVLDSDHQFQLSIEEQIATMMANGLAMSTPDPKLVVFATFAAFFEGIAREGMEMWRYQRNLTGANEGLNVAFHLSHVGSCTGRDHFSGWSLDWINLAIGYLPYLDRFYAPADARAAFVAIRDLASRYGAHILGIPRDNLPILTRPGSADALWNADSPWTDVNQIRAQDGAKKALLAFGATAFVAAEASDQLAAEGLAADAWVVNGLPLDPGRLAALFKQYPEGIVTIEDGLIGTPETGIRGFAGLVRGAAHGKKLPLVHLGIVDPRIAPSEGHLELWQYFGIDAPAAVAAVQSL